MLELRLQPTELRSDSFIGAWGLAVRPGLRPGPAGAKRSALDGARATASCSIAGPLLKIGALALLAWSVQLGRLE